MTHTALITGASRGLGYALAEALAPTHHIIAVAKTTGALEELDDAIQARGATTTLAPMDITNTDAMATLCRGIFDRWGNLDLWIHCAIHAAPLAPTNHIDSKDLAKSIACNVTATATLISFVSRCWEQMDRPYFLMIRAVGKSSLAATRKQGCTNRPRPLMAGRNREHRAKVHILTPPPMPTATRARFYPGENRDGLTHAKDAAAALLSQL